MTYEHVLLDRAGAVATITMNRPEKRNALSAAHMGELIDALRVVGAERDVGVVVLAGAGPAFCAGHDLRELVGRDLAACRRVFSRCVELMTAVQAIPQPVIARVHGIATAAGCQLVATCDLAIAADTATFATPGVSIGLFCTTPMVAVTRAVGRKRAMEMLLTGAAVDAATAADWGLINRAVPAARLDDEVAALAERIAAASRVTVGIGKRAFYAQIDLDQAGAYAAAAETMSTNALRADAQEGMDAFIAKRPPRWRHE